MTTCCPTVIVDNFCAIKDPDEVLDYTINWSDVLDASNPVDSITVSTWEVAEFTNGADLNMDSDTLANPFTTIWLSGGGVLNSIHKVINHITTAGGRQYERTIKIWIQNKGGRGGYAGMTVGIPGIDGVDGSNGNDGVTGTQGPKGDTGATGASGADGTDGTDGTDPIIPVPITGGIENLGLTGVTTSGDIVYTTIGNLVIITGRLLIVSDSSGGSAAAFIAGLTYECSQSTGITFASKGINLGGSISSERTMIGRLTAGSNEISLHKWGSTGQEGPMEQNKFNNGDYIDLNFTYYSDEVSA
jgi:hypothetical protein